MAINETGAVGPAPEPNQTYGKELDQGKHQAPRSPVKGRARRGTVNQAIRPSPQAQLGDSGKQGETSFDPDVASQEALSRVSNRVSVQSSSDAVVKNKTLFHLNRRKNGQFEKGTVPNPRGRPKGAVEIGTYLREWLKRGDPTTHEERTNLERIIETLAEDDPKTLLHYAYGKPIERHEVHQSETSFDPQVINLGRALLLEAWQTSN